MNKENKCEDMEIRNIRKGRNSSHDTLILDKDKDP
jgi:hypothetical protein